MVQRFNITVPKKYEKNGEEKTAWNTVGTLVQFPPKREGDPDGFIIELPMFGSTVFKVFPQNEDRQKKSSEEKDW